MSRDAREAALKRFRESKPTALAPAAGVGGGGSGGGRPHSVSTSSQPQPYILLASLNACGVGLNLTCASCVVLLDLWWNPAVEAQALDRVHRLGQTQVGALVGVLT